MKTIGLVGGVASGKSLVAKLLVAHGAGLLDADRAGHAVLAEDTVVQELVRERWGGAVFTATGEIDRKAVAAKVFAEGPSARLDREFLEELTHPRIAQRLRNEAGKFRASGRPAVVLDAALLFEAGWDEMCDMVVFVDSPHETRLARARTRGWSDAEFGRRESAQWSVEDKRRLADYVLNNDGTESELRQAVADFWDRHIDAAAAKP